MEIPYTITVRSRPQLPSIAADSIIEETASSGISRNNDIINSSLIGWQPCRRANADNAVVPCMCRVQKGIPLFPSARESFVTSATQRGRNCDRIFLSSFSLSLSRARTGPHPRGSQSGVAPCIRFDSPRISATDRLLPDCPVFLTAESADLCTRAHVHGSLRARARVRTRIINAT